VLVLAQEEARLLNHNFIGTEHLLLGLIEEGDGVAAKALAGLGIDLEAVRAEVKDTIGPVASSTTGSVPFTPRSKKVLELSLREAQQLGHDYIGTEHLLLGLVREGEGVAARVLVGLGADLARVRQQVVGILSGFPPGWDAEGSATTIGPPEPVRPEPRCPACRSILVGNVGYRVLPVPAVEDESGSGSIDVIFVYCLRCQVVIAHTPEAAVRQT